MPWRQPWGRSTLEILLDEIEILCSFLWVCYYVFDANLEWRSSLGTFLNKLSNPDCSPHDLQEKISYFRVILHGLVIHQSDALPIQWHPNQIRFAQPFYSGKGVLKYFGLTVQLNLIKKSLLTTNLILTLLHLASNIFALPKRSRSDALVGWSCQVLLQVINLVLPVLKEHLISANRWPSNAWSWVYFITVLVSTVNMEKYFVSCKGGCDGWKLISSQNQIRSTSSGINWLIRPNSPRVMRILADLSICVIWLTPFKGKLM